MKASGAQLAQRLSVYRSLSWSWVSIDTSISYKSQMLGIEPEHGRNWVQDEPPYPQESSAYHFGAFSDHKI